jgi:hypothetical protein
MILRFIMYFSDVPMRVYERCVNEDYYFFVSFYRRFVSIEWNNKTLKFLFFTISRSSISFVFFYKLRGNERGEKKIIKVKLEEE